MTPVRRARARRDQAGTTLIESILVILIVGSIILALAAGLLASTVSARKVNDGQRLSLATTSFTETLRDMSYLPAKAGCSPANDAATYLAAYNALPSSLRTATEGVQLEIIDVKYWKQSYGATTSIPAALQWSGLCSDGSGAQKLKVRLTTRGGTPGGSGSAEVEVVKRQASRGA